MKMEKRRTMVIIMVPYPAQGHLTPMLRLASSFLLLNHHSLDSLLLRPVILLPHFLHPHILLSNIDPRISLLPIPPPPQEDHTPPGDFFAADKAMEQASAGQLEGVVRRVIDEEGSCCCCMVVDLLVSSALDVARRCGVPVAGFWPASLLSYRLIAAIPQLVASGIIHPHTGIPQHQGLSIGGLEPNQPPLTSDDLPWLIGSLTARKARFKFWTKTLHRSTNLQCILVNSFQELDRDDDSNNPSLHKPQRILQVGPLIEDQPRSTISLWDHDSTCLQWLDTQKPRSVVYISFGSWVSPIGESKVMALATALEAIGTPFIWVLGSAWRQGLPSGYEERLSIRGGGQVVKWAPQMEVLMHIAVGCYLTHCGWNSTMEAIQCRKRMLCYPIAGDQFVNCKYVVEKWRVGVRLNGFGRCDVEEGLRKIMCESDPGNGEMSCRLDKLCEMSTGKVANLKRMANLNSFVDLVMDKC
uniref:Glycosyltransferase n=1 Tax=Linum usitatissimum TaxID=4006 RepID=I2BH83_LINUS|nr:UDP-glycosyltransferase 1 [Linum usitatissimum]